MPVFVEFCVKGCSAPEVLCCSKTDSAECHSSRDVVPSRDAVSVTRLSDGRTDVTPQLRDMTDGRAVT